MVVRFRVVRLALVTVTIGVATAVGCSLTHDVDGLDRAPDAGCGLLGTRCCEGGPRCDTGLACDGPSDTCVACGADGQPCCGGTKPCNDWFLCSADRCTPCGANPQPCCGGTTTCKTGLSCQKSSSTCVEMKAVGTSCCELASCTTKQVCTDSTCCCGGTGACSTCGAGDAGTAGGSCKSCCIACGDGKTTYTRPTCADATSLCATHGGAPKTEWLKSCP